MPNKITEIRNLTQSKSIGLNGDIKVAQTELDKFVLSANSEQVTGTGLLEASTPDDFSVATDNIQVTWTDDAAKTHRAVGGKWSKTGTTVTITNLLDVSKYSVGLTGQLEIGPSGGRAALISVSIGNLNPAHDWIIDFSDKQDGASGSEIDLQALIDWIQKKIGQSDGPDLPPSDLVKSNDGKEAPPLTQFIIVFKNFYFNITQKTFDFWVASKEGQSITFGDFTINKVGFRVTNVPVLLPTAEVLKELAPPNDKPIE